MSDEDVLEYQNWPASQEEGEATARGVFGKYLVGVYDNSLNKVNKMLYEGLRYKSEDVRDKQMYDWIGRLPEEDRESAFLFARYNFE